MEAIIIVLLIMAAAAGFVVYKKSAEVSAVTERNTICKSEIEERDGRISELEKEAEQGRADKIKIARLEIEIEGYEKEIRTLKDVEQRLTKEFENISNRIFDDKNEKFKKQNKEGLENILSPLKKDIKDFRDKFAETDKDFTGKFGELKSQIETLSDLNKTIGAEAQNLTKALKGDSKQMGDWGELVLEKTLEMSGLREGRDYEKQKSFSGDTTSGDTTVDRKPDVVVHLPDGKDIVIDSKVSLADYERYCSSDDESERAGFLKEHMASVERHYKTLGEKDYQNLHGIRTLNFVLMFVPVEPAYILTVNARKDIFKKALDKNVVLVCPSTLLAVLRTVHSLWQMEDQNANAREIAGEAGKLYDKFAGFIDQMEKIDKQLGTVRNSFDTAYNSLSKGRGNIVGRAEKMKQLGAKTAKSLPGDIVRESGEEETHKQSGQPEEAELI